MNCVPCFLYIWMMAEERGCIKGHLAFFLAEFVGSPGEIRIRVSFLGAPVGRFLLGEGIQSRLVAGFWRQCYA